MREHYGEQRAQGVSDHEWIALTAERGWIGFHKDDNIRRNQLERQTVLDIGARLFCVPRVDLLAEDAAARFITNVAAISRAARSPGHSSIPSRRARSRDSISAIPAGSRHVSRSTIFMVSTLTVVTLLMRSTM
ncbi:Putative ribonuclease VapC45 [Mycobacterium simulans]|nr:Putative ribonuclease VapC45 [Mycobacterium simulans]